MHFIRKILYNVTFLCYKKIEFFFHCTFKLEIDLITRYLVFS